MESKVDLLKIDSLSQRLLEKILHEVNNYSEDITNSLNISNVKFKEDLYKIIKNKDIIDKYILD
jgi:hypothetical protein